MRKTSLFLTATLLAGCSGLLPASIHKGASLVLTPHIQAGGYQTQATVSVYTSASIDHLTIKLFDGSKEIAAKTILQGDLAKPITFSNLRANTTYTVKSYAYLANNAQISLDGGSLRTFTTLTDDRPNILSLPVLLSDIPFNGIGTSSIQVANGGYSYAASESLGLLLGTSVGVSVIGRADYFKARLFNAATGLEVATLQRADLNPTFTFNELAESTNYNLWVEAYKLGAMNSSQSVAINVGTEVTPATQSLSFNLPYYIDTVAGTGASGYDVAQDNGPATSAKLNGPMKVALDSGGSLYIVDTLNNRIRKVSDGTITTVVGGGLLATLNWPGGVAVDTAGDLYIADTYNNRVLKLSGGAITTVAGGGAGGDGGAATAASLSSPRGMAFDHGGNLYIAESSRIRMVTQDGMISTVAGGTSAGAYNAAHEGVPATSAKLNTPYGVAVDTSGNLYIADNANNRVRKVSGGIITTVAGGGAGGDGGLATAANLSAPVDVAVDSVGNFYIAASNRVRKVDKNGTITTVAGGGAGGDGGLATAASLVAPYGFALDGSGILYVADYSSHRVRRLR